VRYVRQTVFCSAFSIFSAMIIAQSTGGTLKIQDATAIRLSLMESLSSATNSVDDPVRFEVTEDVNAGGVVAIPRGSTAVGHVVEVEPRRRLGRAGKLNFSIDHVKAPDGTNVRLRASSTRKGDDKTGTVIVGTVLLSPLFLIMRGKDVSIPKGTEVMAYIDGDREIKLPGIVISNAAPAVAPKVVSGVALTNADVIRLRNAALGDQLIIGKIKASPADYHLDTNDIIELKRAGVSEAIMGAMLEASQQTPAQALPTPAVSTVLAEVSFTSNPAGADVSFSGTVVGSTPFVTKLQPGKYSVEMNLDGYAEWTGQLVVEAGKASMVAVQMAH
jgi:PEGA domain